jgi:hypothetical protein
LEDSISKKTFLEYFERYLIFLKNLSFEKVFGGILTFF